MMGLIEEAKGDVHKVSRLTSIKEEHAERVKHEVRVLYGDYFKDDHLKAYPELQDAVLHTLRLASKAKQGVDLQVAKDLLEHTQEIAEIFYKSKNLEPVRVKPPYPTEGELVTHK
jgi:nickel superoxide dismutase